MRAYVERHISHDGAPVIRAWSFDLASWGSVGTGHDAESAAEDLRRWTASDRVEIVEEIEGRDVAFARDLEAATPGERVVTAAIARAARLRTLELLAGAEQWTLDRPVSDAGGAGEALRIADLGVVTTRDLLETLIRRESVEDPAGLGLPAHRDDDLASAGVGDLPLEQALIRSHACALHAASHLHPRLLRATPGGGEWTSVKLLRLLAWRERSLGGLLEALLDPTT